MGTIAQKLEAIAASKVAIREAIEKKGVEVKDAPLSEYAAKIAEIPWNVWPLGVDLEEIYDQYLDTPNRTVVQIWGLLPCTDFAATKGITQVITSDGASYTKFPVTHHWDTSKDIDGKHHKTRWFIILGLDLIATKNSLRPDIASICGIYGKTAGHFSDALSGCLSLKFIKFPSDFTANGDLTRAFSGCYSLDNIPSFATKGITNVNYMYGWCKSIKTIPQLDTIEIISFEGMFYECATLEYIPNLETQNATTFNSMFYNCISLKTIPALKTGNATNMRAMFYNCYSLEYVPKMDTSKCADFGNMFYSCEGLKIVEEIDLSSATAVGRMFDYCTRLTHIRFAGTIPISLSFENYGKLDVDSIMSAIDALKDYTSSNVRTLTLGSSNLAKLTDEQKAIATAKNWILN